MAVSMSALSIVKTLNSGDFIDSKFCGGDYKKSRGMTLKNLGDRLMPGRMASDKLLGGGPKIESGFVRLSSKAMIDNDSRSEIGSMPDFDTFDTSNFRRARKKKFTRESMKPGKKLNRDLGGLTVRVNSPEVDNPECRSPIGQIADQIKMSSGRSLLYRKDQNFKQMSDPLKPARSHRVISTTPLGLMGRGIQLKTEESDLQGSETELSVDTSGLPRKSAAIFNPTVQADVGDLAYKLIKKHLPSLDRKQDKLHYLKTVFPTFKIPNDISMGQGFGEMALLSDNQLRMGTTVCMEDCEVLVVRRSIFREVLVNLNKTELQKEIDFLKGFNIFDNWAEEKMIIKFSLLLAHIDLENGEHVFREGDKVNGFYL